ncbi:MAG: hypothetical protein HY754_02035 [Nitrospirae bacterium]|nr:hypothetical protein [Nitrospirota bacterium]
MHFVLDANEYIFALGLFRKESCESLIQYFMENFSLHSVSICRTIIEEARDNLTLKDFQKFIKFINMFAVIDEDFLIPFELGVKYELKGLKEADALIAAYTEWVGADALVTENRHFLSKNPNLPFKVLTAESCLKFITASLQ